MQADWGFMKLLSPAWSTLSFHTQVYSVWREGCRLKDVLHQKERRHGVQEIGSQKERDESNFQVDDSSRS